MLGKRLDYAQESWFSQQSFEVILKLRHPGAGRFLKNLDCWKEIPLVIASPDDKRESSEEAKCLGKRRRLDDAGSDWISVKSDLKNVLVLSNELNKYLAEVPRSDTLRKCAIAKTGPSKTQWKRDSD